jgi:hypothetical protein
MSTVGEIGSKPSAVLAYIPRNRKQFKGKLTGIVYDGIEMPSEKGIEFGMVRNETGGIGDTTKVTPENICDMSFQDVFQSTLDDKVREHLIHHTLRDSLMREITCDCLETSRQRCQQLTD